MSDLFRRFAAATSCALGSPLAFLLAIAFVVVWAATGPYFDYSNTWQLIINTSTTIATFLMVFLLQSTQNRDTKAINIKLDELLRAIEGSAHGIRQLERSQRRRARQARSGTAQPRTASRRRRAPRIIDNEWRRTARACGTRRYRLIPPN
jgi:low affinity Fe/Cu permease